MHRHTRCHSFGDILSGDATDAGIVLAGGVGERAHIANGRVAVLGRVAPERKNMPYCRVCWTRDVVLLCSAPRPMPVL